MDPFVHSLGLFKSAGFLNVPYIQAPAVHQIQDVPAGFFLVDYDIDGRHCYLLLFRSEKRIGKQINVHPEHT